MVEIEVLQVNCPGVVALYTLTVPSARSTQMRLYCVFWLVSLKFRSCAISIG